MAAKDQGKKGCTVAGGMGLRSSHPAEAYPAPPCTEHVGKNCERLTEACEPVVAQPIVGVRVAYVKFLLRPLRRVYGPEAHPPGNCFGHQAWVAGQCVHGKQGDVALELRIRRVAEGPQPVADDRLGLEL